MSEVNMALIATNSGAMSKLLIKHSLAFRLWGFSMRNMQFQRSRSLVRCRYALIRAISVLALALQT
jgi:hypothetical protein